MKRYRLTVDGQTYDVRVLSDPRQREVLVEVDGTRLTVLGGASPGGTGTDTMSADGPPQTRAETDQTVTGADQPATTAGKATDNVVSAPLPGVVKSIAVQPGHKVSAGDELLVIEAMKMDNAIRAGRQGIISAVFVSEGHRVTHGQRLLEYGE
jgi:biotin carboxyl carrier protein